MAAQGNVTPKADQPRVSTETLAKQSAGPTLQYRNQGIKSYGTRSTKRSDRLTRG